MDKEKEREDEEKEEDLAKGKKIIKNTNQGKHKTLKGRQQKAG